MPAAPLILLAHILSMAFLFQAGAREPRAESTPDRAPAGPLSRVRQLTFEGRRAGEGYFSPDGTRMVFQSERAPDNPFFQIYVLDLATGDSRRVSTGTGKTTCAFFRPASEEILFASTHHDPHSEELQKAELADRAAGRQRRYEWDFDPEMELYVAGGKGGLRRLTNVQGYDAEGSYSPDGQWIVFSSTRAAYATPLSETERALRETDPSAFAEIYRMRADGSGVERLTSTMGYDGGPFFFADGSRIVWRRFALGGALADIWTMNADGSDPRRITDFGAMSWAPFAHPSGEYLFFTASKFGLDNFELFIVDVAGAKEPVRVTDSPGFDGLPVPSPDGRRLSFTSNRRQDKGQIFLGEWDHRAAQAALAAAPPRSSPAGGH